MTHFNMFTRRYVIGGVLFLALSVLSQAVGADSPPPALQPAHQPLLVVRAKNPDVVFRLLETRQLRAVDGDDLDFSGTVPGLGFRVASLRLFLKGLSDKGAKNVLYYMGGRSVLSAAAAIGCEWPGNSDTESIEAWLDDFFPDHGLALNLQQYSPDRQRWWAAANADVLAELDGKRGYGAESWRSDLKAFLLDDSDALAVWMNSRPLVGVASLTSGIDLRSEAVRLGLSMPDTLELRLSPGQDISCSLKLAHVLSREMDDTDTAPVFISSRNAPLVQVAIPRPLALLREFAGGEPLLFLANIDIRAVEPESLSFNLVRDPDGNLTWTVICHILNGERFKRQFPRIRAWLKIFADAPDAGFRMSETSLPDDGSLLRLAFGRVSCVARAMDGKNGSVFLVFAGTENALPNLGDIRLIAGDPSAIAAWRMNPDDGCARLLAERLAARLKAWGVDNLPAEKIERLIGHGDIGDIGREDDSLVIHSERGCGPLIFAGLALAVEEWTGSSSAE